MRIAFVVGLGALLLGQSGGKKTGTVLVARPDGGTARENVYVKEVEHFNPNCQVELVSAGKLVMPDGGVVRFPAGSCLNPP